MAAVGPHASVSAPMRMGLLRSAAPTSQMSSALAASSKNGIKYHRIISLTDALSHLETGMEKSEIQDLVFRPTQGRLWATPKNRKSFLSSYPSPFASHLITLSALASTFGGIVRPICFAVLRLM